MYGVFVEPLPLPLPLPDPLPDPLLEPLPDPLPLSLPDPLPLPLLEPLLEAQQQKLCPHWPGTPDPVRVVQLPVSLYQL